jgi:hypothetical protein
LPDLFTRMWEQLLARVSGPLSFRMILQPTVAAILAIRAGLKDAREGQPAYLWAVLFDPSRRHHLIRGGWRDASRVFIFACVIDAIYQLIILRWFHPLQMLIVAGVLALVPYVLIRGPINRLARQFHWATRAERRKRTSTAQVDVKR